MQRRNKQTRKQVAPRTLSPLEKDILDIVRMDFTNVLYETLIHKAALLREQVMSEQSNVHPAYLTLLYGASSVFCMLKEPFSPGSKQFVNQALQVMEQNKTVIVKNADEDWREQQEQIMDLFYNYFALLLAHMANFFQSDDVGTIIIGICSKHDTLKPSNSVVYDTTVFFMTLHKVLKEIKGQHEALKKYGHYYIDRHFEQIKIFCLLFEIIESCVWKSFNVTWGSMPEQDQSEYVYNVQRVKQSVQNCIEYLLAIDRPSDPVLIDTLPPMVAFAHRLSRIRMEDSFSFNYFAVVLHNKLIKPWCKQRGSEFHNLWFQQFYFDVIASTIVRHQFEDEWQWNHQKINEYLKGKAFVNTHCVWHLSIVWHGLSSMLSDVLYRYMNYTHFKVRQRIADSYAQHVELSRLYQKQLAKPHFLPAGSYSLSIKRRIIEEVNVILQKLMPSIDLLKKVTKDYTVLTLIEMIPLYCADGIMPWLFTWLPTIEQFRESLEWLSLPEMHIASKRYQEDASLLKKCYIQLKDVLLYLSDRPEWFMEGPKIAATFKKFVHEILDSRLLAIAEVERQEGKKILEYAESYQNALNLSIQMTNRFVDEQAVTERKQRERREQRKSSKMDAFSKQYQVILQRDTVTQDDFEKTLDEATSHAHERTLQDKAVDIYDRAMQAFSRRYYYKARECFKALGELHHDYAPRAREGVFVSQLEIVIKQLTDLRHKLEAMTSSNKVSHEQAQSCEVEVERLQKEYQSLVLQYQSILENGKGDIDPANFQFLNDRKRNLDDAWKKVESVKDAVMIRLNFSRYEKIMSLGFAKNAIEDEQVKRELFDAGINVYVNVTKKNKKTSKLSKQFQLVYNAGIHEFRALGERNKQEFGESPYVSFREMLLNLDNMIHSARMMMQLTESHSTESSRYTTQQDAGCEKLQNAPCSTAAPTPTAATTLRSTAPTSSVTTAIAASSESTSSCSVTMSHVELLNYLLESQLTNLAEKAILSRWIEEHPKSLWTIQQQGILEAGLAYESLSAWFLTNDLKARIIFLDETGLLRWFLSFPGKGPLILAANMNDLKRRLDMIGASIAKVSHDKWQVDLILAQIINTIIVSAVDQAWLLDNLTHFGLVDKPLHQMCEALQLSSACQSALHAYLVTSVRLRYHPKLPANETVKMLDEAVQQYNRPLLADANIEIMPVCVIIYGSYAYIHLIRTDHVPADLDVRTNLPLAKWPFEKVPHQHLAAHHVYERCFIGPQIENGVSIKLDDAPIMNVIQMLDFTISQAMFHVGLGSMVYWTNAAYEDLLKNKVLSFVKAAGAFYEDPQLIFRVLIAGNNTKFYLREDDATKLTTLLVIECDTARKDNRTFLKPFSDPGCLLHFLFRYCVYRSAEQYLTLAMHYGILPFLLPVPFDTSSSSTAYANFQASLQQFDKERADSQKQVPDGWMLLGKLIALVFRETMSSCKDSKSLMVEAKKELAHFLPSKPKLLSAVSHYLDFYENQSSLKSANSSSSSVFTPIANETALPPGVRVENPMVPTQNM